MYKEINTLLNLKINKISKLFNLINKFIHF